MVSEWVRWRVVAFLPPISPSGYFVYWRIFLSDETVENSSHLRIVPKAECNIKLGYQFFTDISQSYWVPPTTNSKYPIKNPAQRGFLSSPIQAYIDTLRRATVVILLPKNQRNWRAGRGGGSARDLRHDRRAHPLESHFALSLPEHLTSAQCLYWVHASAIQWHQLPLIQSNI